MNTKLNETYGHLIIDTVDKRLYDAKAAGKNKILSTQIALSAGTDEDQKNFLKAMDQMHHALNQLQIRLMADLNHEMLQERFHPLEQNLLLQMVNQLDTFAKDPNTLPYLLKAPLKDDVSLATHNLRTAFYALHLANVSEVSNSERLSIGLAAILHDIGKLRIPVEIINKPDRLTPEEYALVKNHSDFGYELVKKEFWLSPSAKQAILNHHERLDGTGYPHQLLADELALPERILAVADVFDAMTSHRTYKPSVSVEQALELLLTEETHRLDLQLIQFLISLAKGDPDMLKKSCHENSSHRPEYHLRNQQHPHRHSELIHRAKMLTAEVKALEFVVKKVMNPSRVPQTWRPESSEVLTKYWAQIHFYEKALI